MFVDWPWDHGGHGDSTCKLVESDPLVVHGQARFRGTRVPVSVVLDCLAAGMDETEILEQYPSLPDGPAIRAAIAYRRAAGP